MRLGQLRLDESVDIGEIDRAVCNVTNNLSAHGRAGHGARRGHHLLAPVYPRCIAQEHNHYGQRGEPDSLAGL